jgi:excinuclease ABC subunit A
LISLRDLGNTVVVEHDEDIMKAADMIIDIGPGSFGGELVAQGTFDEILKSTSLTAKYLNGDLEISVPKKRRKFKNFIEIKGKRK